MGIREQSAFLLDRNVAPLWTPTNTWIDYFLETQDAAFGVVPRRWLEERLRYQLRSDMDSIDPSWYALRNMVYAHGCRIGQGRKAALGSDVDDSWPWFANALSVLSQILCFRASLVAVQALVLMVIFHVAAVEALPLTCR